MNLVDSSGWLEFFTDGPLADKYAPYLADLQDVLTPTIVLYEVYKRVKREKSEEEALVATAQMKKSRVVDLSAVISLTAADFSLENRLAMADAIVYATASLHRATVITSDDDFEGLPGVIYFSKKP